jgi:hypothetical protein
MNSETVVATQRLGELLLPYQQPIVCTTTQPFDKVFPIRFAKDYLKGMADWARQSSYKITIMKMFAPLDKAKPLTENTRGSNLAAVKHTTVQVSTLPQ